MLAAKCPGATFSGSSSAVSARPSDREQHENNASKVYWVFERAFLNCWFNMLKIEPTTFSMLWYRKNHKLLTFNRLGDGKTGKTGPNWPPLTQTF
jgi:hypothetical protein